MESLKFVPDKWQSEVMAHKGNVHLRTGRQVGKSTVISMKTYDFALGHPGTTTLCIAASVRQASYIYDKITALFERDNEKLIMASKADFRKKKGRFPTYQELRSIQMDASLYKDIPTKTKIVLKNGASIYCLPAGKTGIFIMGLTIDLLVADEAAFIPEPVWNAVLPMVMVSRKLRGLGMIWLLSTPFGKGGYFYACESDDQFGHWQVSSEDCPRADMKFLYQEKRRMTKQEYAQMYLGEYADEYNQFFLTSLIRRQSTFIEWDTDREYKADRRYYMGVDIARYGGDENAFVVCEMDGKDRMRMVKVLTTNQMPLTDTIGRILKLDERFKFRKIFIDDAGIGGGVMDVLLEKMGRKVVGINNAKRSIDRDDRKKAIMKEDLYSNALVLLEAGKLEMIADLKLEKSLKSITYEYTSDKNLRLTGNYSHIAEAFVRAAWCIRERGLRVFIA